MARRIDGVYISASSADIKRVEGWTDRLGLAGITVVSTWPAVIAASGADANPRNATRMERLQWSNQDLAEVMKCDLVWFLMPSTDTPTRGAWLEVGYAHAKGKALVFSGDTKQSVFGAIGPEFDEDIDAFATICRMVCEGSR